MMLYLFNPFCNYNKNNNNSENNNENNNNNNNNGNNGALDSETKESYEKKIQELEEQLKKSNKILPMQKATLWIGQAKTTISKINIGLWADHSKTSTLKKVEVKEYENGEIKIKDEEVEEQ